MVGAKASKERRCGISERPVCKERPLKLSAKGSAECDLFRNAPEGRPAVGKLTLEPLCNAERLRNCKERCAIKNAPLLRAIKGRTKVGGTTHVWISAVLTQRGDLFRELTSARRQRISQRWSSGERQLTRWGEGTSNGDQREERAPLQALK
jgi:hypothetical protein